MSFLPHIFGIRTVVTIHGLDWQRSKWGRFASWYLKLGEKIAVVCSDEMIVLNQATKQYFWENYKKHTVLIPNGVERPVRRSARMITEKWGLEKDQYILYLGRIVPEKGLKYLVRAFRKVKTDKKLVIAGGPSDTEGFFRQMREIAGADKRIIFTGVVGGTVLDELYSNSYFYCLPSEVEGMPISLLEAMSYGNYCLVSDIAECVDVVGKFGCSFKKGDTEDLRRVMQMLCETPQVILDCRDGVSDYVCTCYNWDDITEKTLALYGMKMSD